MATKKTQKTTTKPSAKQVSKQAQTQRAHEAARLLRRLWDGHSGTETRRGIELAPIVDAAVVLADKRGLDAVSMRAVADAVGFPAMSLYSHVAGKGELVALMQDAVLRDLYDGPLPGGVTSWRAGLTIVAETNRAVFRRHPWLLRLGGPRPVLGPHLCRKYEIELGALDGSGLSDVDNDAALSLVLGHVAGTAWSRFAQQETDSSSGQSDREWWSVVAPVLEAKMDGALFPLSGRVGEAAAHANGGVYDDDRAFVFGLARILDGIGLLMAAPSR